MGKEGRVRCSSDGEGGRVCCRNVGEGARGMVCCRGTRWHFEIESQSPSLLPFLPLLPLLFLPLFRFPFLLSLFLLSPSSHLFLPHLPLPFLLVTLFPPPPSPTPSPYSPPSFLPPPLLPSLTPPTTLAFSLHTNCLRSTTVQPSGWLTPLSWTTGASQTSSTSQVLYMHWYVHIASYDVISISPLQRKWKGWDCIIQSSGL